MISFAKLMRQVLSERVSFRDLFRISEPGRKQRAKTDVKARSIRVNTMDEQEVWTFNYKSNPSTTGNRWHGYVRFFKEDVSHKDNAMDLHCMVDCDCPDYRYRYAYNNARADIGVVGSQPEWKYANQNNGKPPRPRADGGVGDYGVGMCKHLCSLAEFLKTQIEPDAPEPDDEIEPKTSTIKPASIKQPRPSSPSSPTTSNAPNPDDSYSDSRGDSSSDSEYSDGRELQQEGQKSMLYEKFDRFVKTNPIFDVTYE